MALSKVQAESIDLTATYAFSGTVSEVGAVRNLVLLQTLTADNSATTLTFDSGIDNTYQSYLFRFINMQPATDTADLQVNFRDGSTAYDATKTTTYFETYHNEAGGTTGLGYVEGLDIAQGTGFQTIHRYVGNGADECSAGELELFDPSSTTFVKHFVSVGHDYTGNDYTNSIRVAGYCNVTAAIDGVQFKSSSGNIKAGTIKMYGVL
jgi:hypothetical protein